MYNNDNNFAKVNSRNYYGKLTQAISPLLMTDYYLKDVLYS